MSKFRNIHVGRDLDSDQLGRTLKTVFARNSSQLSSARGRINLLSYDKTSRLHATISAAVLADLYRKLRLNALL